MKHSIFVVVTISSTSFRSFRSKHFVSFFFSSSYYCCCCYNYTWLVSNEAIWENKINLEFAALSNARSVCVYVCVTLVKSPLGDFEQALYFIFFPSIGLTKRQREEERKRFPFPTKIGLSSGFRFGPNWAGEVTAALLTYYGAGNLKNNA